MKKTIFSILAAPLLWFGSCYIATAQDATQSDQIQLPTGQIIQDDSSSTGTFEAVTVFPSASSNVALQFPPTMAGRPVAITALDGGTVTPPVTGSPSISADGSLSFSFQVSDQPGLHRVVVIDPNADEDSPHIVAIVQFEVPNPAE